MKTKENLILFHLAPEVKDFFALYRRAKSVYSRTQFVLGRIPFTGVSYSSTIGIEVSNGTNFSTKIYTVK